MSVGRGEAKQDENDSKQVLSKEESEAYHREFKQFNFHFAHVSRLYNADKLHEVVLEAKKALSFLTPFFMTSHKQFEGKDSLDMDFIRGVLYEVQGNAEVGLEEPMFALDSFTKALSFVKSSKIYVFRGQVYHRLAEVAKSFNNQKKMSLLVQLALSDFRAAVKCEPRNPIPHIQMAEIFLQTQGATAEYRNALDAAGCCEYQAWRKSRSKNDAVLNERTLCKLAARKFWQHVLLSRLQISTSEASKQMEILARLADTFRLKDPDLKREILLEAALLLMLPCQPLSGRLNLFNVDIILRSDEAAEIKQHIDLQVAKEKLLEVRRTEDSYRRTESYFLLGWVQTLTQDFDQAILSLQESRLYEERRSMTLFLLGKIYVHFKNNPREAYRCFDRVYTHLKSSNMIAWRVAMREASYEYLQDIPVEEQVEELVLPDLEEEKPEPVIVPHVRKKNRYKQACIVESDNQNIIASLMDKMKNDVVLIEEARLEKAAKERVELLRMYPHVASESGLSVLHLLPYFTPQQIGFVQTLYDALLGMKELYLFGSVVPAMVCHRLHGADLVQPGDMDILIKTQEFKPMLEVLVGMGFERMKPYARDYAKFQKDVFGKLFDVTLAVKSYQLKLDYMLLLDARIRWGENAALHLRETPDFHAACENKRFALLLPTGPDHYRAFYSRFIKYYDRTRGLFTYDENSEIVLRDYAWIQTYFAKTWSDNTFCKGLIEFVEMMYRGFFARPTATPVLTAFIALVIERSLPELVLHDKVDIAFRMALAMQGLPFSYRHHDFNLLRIEFYFCLEFFIKHAGLFTQEPLPELALQEVISRSSMVVIPSPEQEAKIKQHMNLALQLQKSKFAKQGGSLLSVKYGQNFLMFAPQKSIAIVSAESPCMTNAK